MIKIVCKGAMPSARALRFFFHSNPDRLIALTDAAATATADEAAMLAGEFSDVVRDICVNGVWKKTRPGRLPLTEEAIVRFLEERGPAYDEKTPLRALDIGGSDGSTTATLFALIDERAPGGAEVHLGDLSLHLVRFHRGAVVEYRSTAGDPVMVRLGPLGLRLPEPEYAWSWWSHALARWYLRQAAFRQNMEREQKISMISPVAVRIPGIVPLEMNCLVQQPTLVGRLDIVRASNILSPRYFTNEQIRHVLAHVHAYLQDGGYLLVSRNDDHSEVERGSGWRRTYSGFEHVDEFGGGSEIKPLVDTFVIDAEQARA